MLSTSDKEQIVASIKKVEAETGGEVVVSVVPRCDTYSVARWRAAVFFFLGALAVILIMRSIAKDWVPVLFGEDLSVILLGIIIGFLAGVLTTRIPMLTRTFVLDREFSRAVARAASEEFIAEEIFETTRRHGILIFVSELERMFEVIADAGIDERIDSREWIEVVDSMIRRQKDEGLTEAILTGVSECGHLLARELPALGFAKNELSDQVRDGEGSE